MRRPSLRTVLSCFVVATVAATVLPAATGSAANNRPMRAFSEQSWWNTPLPKRLPDHPREKRILRYLRTAPQAKGGCVRLAGAGKNKWGQPVYWSKPRHRTYRVRSTKYKLPRELRNLRIPRKARPAATKDAAMTVFDVRKGYVVALWRARYDRRRDRWSAGGAAVTYLRSNGLHKRTGLANDPRNNGSMRGNNGAVAMARFDEVRSGVIPHVLKISSGPELSRRYVFPMINSDGDSRRAAAPPQGLRLRIKPGVNIAKRVQGRQARVIARAMKRYGVYLGDSGGTTSLKLENTRAEGRGQKWRVSADALCSLPLSRKFWDVVPERYDAETEAAIRKKPAPATASPESSASVSPSTGSTSSTAEPTESPSPTSTGSATPSPTVTSGSPGTDAAPAPVAGGPYLPYTSGAFFRSSVLGAPVDQALTDRFRTFMATHPDQRGTPYPVIRGLGSNKWGTVYAEGRASDPVWRLTGRVPAPVSFLTTTGFRAPEWLGDALTGTSDSPFVVMDRASGLSVWAAKARPGPGRTIEVGAAGAYEHRSNGLDKRNPRSDSTVNYRSRGAIPDSMVIRRDRLDWAVANDTDLGYVLHLFLVETDTSAGHVSPMVGHESDKYGFGAEGTRIAIDPSIDLSKRGLSPAGLAVARTLQTRGAYIGDNSGSQTALKAEQETSAQPVWGNRLREDDLEGVSWRDFVVIRPGWQ
jgi:hypothetical protein